MINLYYDELTPFGPVPNGIRNWTYSLGKFTFPILDGTQTYKNPLCLLTMFLNTMEKVGVQAKFYTDNNYTDNTYYPLEIQNQYDYDLITLPGNVIELCKNKKLKILILFQEEGAAGYTFQPVLNLCKKFQDMGVPYDSINVVLGDLNNTFAEFFEPFAVYGLDWWQVKHQITCKSRYLDDDATRTTLRPYDRPLSEERKKKESFDIELWNNPQKLFLSYNGGMRFHRLGLVSELIYRNLDKHGYLSWNTRLNNFTVVPDDARIVDHYHPSVKRKVEINQELLNKKITLDFLDESDFLQDDRAFDNRHFYDSCFSIVTETFAPHQHNNYVNRDCEILWTTEKTWKPISIGHPFMVLGSVGTLKYLRSEGYFTFPELFDESYDDEPILLERIKKIVDNVEALSRLSLEDLHKKIESIKPKLKHNKELFYTKDHANKFIDLFNQMESSKN